MSAPDFATITSRQQETWGLGDFNVLAMQTMAVAEALVAEVDPRPTQRVLDIACGSGNIALVAARRHCDVVGLDFVESLVARARRRAEADGVAVEFRQGDAQALPYDDASFDVVMSQFGVMFAPDQERAAAELLRVTRPGGTIALACWMPTEFGGEIFRAMAKFGPPPPGLKPPNRWGTQDGVLQLLGVGAAEIHCEKRTFTQFFPSVDHAVDVVVKFFGPAVRAYGLLDDAGKAAMRADVAAVNEKFNRATDGTLVMECAYLRTLARRR